MVRIVIGRNMHFNETVANHLALRVVRRLREMDFNVEDVPRRLEPDERKRLKGLLADFRHRKVTGDARAVHERIKDEIVYPLPHIASPQSSAKIHERKLEERARRQDTLVYDFHNVNYAALPHNYADGLRELAKSQKCREYSWQEFQDGLARMSKEVHPVFVISKAASGNHLNLKTVEIACVGKPVLGVEQYEEYGSAFCSDHRKSVEAGVNLKVLEDFLVHTIATEAGGLEWALTGSHPPKR